MRLIDADALWKEFDTAHLFDNGNPRHIAQQVVEDAPTVDIVIEGAWIPCKNNSGYKCSKCGARIKNSAFFNGNHNYCPKCGSAMKGK